MTSSALAGSGIACVILVIDWLVLMTGVRFGILGKQEKQFFGDILTSPAGCFSHCNSLLSVTFEPGYQIAIIGESAL
jgi:hypothetical protein